MPGFCLEEHSNGKSWLFELKGSTTTVKDGEEIEDTSIYEAVKDIEKPTGELSSMRFEFYLRRHALASLEKLA